MSGRTLYGIELRRRAVELYEEGHGRYVIYPAQRPRGNRETMAGYLQIRRHGSSDGRGSKTAYSFEVKVAAARAVADEGMTVPEAMAEFGSPWPVLWENG